MVVNPMIPVGGGVFLFLVVVAFIVFTGIRGPRRGRVGRIARRVGIAVALLAIGLRPGIPDSADRTIIASDIDVFIAMDTTGSVAAEDYDGTKTRLEGMKGDVAEILEGFPGARVSLITFDAVAVIRVPLTRDTSTVLSALEVLTTEITTYSSGSTISEPVGLLTETLTDAREATPDHKRVLFYLGDGEQTASGDPETFAPVADLVEGGAVLGYGTEEGGRMLENKGSYFSDDYYYDDDYYEENPDEEPAPAPTYIKDFSAYPNEDALSTIDETNLTAIADQLGVSYVHRTSPGGIAVLEELNTPGEVELENSGEKSVQELYWIFALSAFVLLLWEIGVIAVGVVDAFAAGRKRA